MNENDREFEKLRRARLIYGDNDMGRIKKKQHEVAMSLLQSSQADSEENGKRSFWDSLIISKNSKRKSLFDIIMLLLVAYSCFTTMFYVTFGSPDNQKQIYFDYAVNVFFAIDLFLNFLVEYEDPETFQDERRFKKIALRYVFSF